MCFSYSVNFNAEALKSRLQLDEIMLPQSGFFFSAFTWPKLPVIVSENGKLKAVEKQWGLIPSWCKDEENAQELRKLALNAKGETVHQKPMFRGGFKHGRCLVPAAGFYEWREVNRKKYPYYIYPANEPAFLFAGISEVWVNPATGEELDTYCIVTSPSNALLSMIHNTKLRMPLILDYADIQTWISGTEEEALSLVHPCAEQLLKAHTVSKLVSQAREDRNVSEVQEPVHYPELDPQTLL